MRLVFLMICFILDRSVQPTSSITYTPSGYMGCFYSYPGFLPSIHYKRMLASFTNTGNECKSKCKANGFKFAGTVAGLNCFCGYGTHYLKRAPTPSCDSVCPGNDKENCGGNSQISLYDMWAEQLSNKWVTAGAGSPVYFIRDTKLDYEKCTTFCSMLKPSSEVGALDKNVKLWLEDNNLLDATEHYWIYSSMRQPGECYYIAGSGRVRVTNCHGNKQGCKQERFQPRVLKASSCSLKYNCICMRRV